MLITTKKVTFGILSKWNQTLNVTDLPNGKYTLTFDVITSTGLEKFKINGVDYKSSIKTDGSASMSNMDAMTKFATGNYRMTVDLDITDGKIMEKNYLKPAIEVVEIEAEGFLGGSATPTVSNSESAEDYGGFN